MQWCKPSNADTREGFLTRGGHDQAIATQGGAEGFQDIPLGSDALLRRLQSVSGYPTCAPLGSLTSPSITTVGTQWYGKTRVDRHVLPKLSRCGASHVN
jgi:hypothetical protein